MELLPGHRPARRHGGAADAGRLRPRGALRRPGGAGGALHRRRRALDPRRRPRRRPARACRTSAACWREIVRLAADGRRQRRVRRRHPLRGRRRGAARVRAWPGSSSARPPSRSPRWPAAAPAAGPGRVAVGLDYRVGDGRRGRGPGPGVAGRVGPRRDRPRSSCGRGSRSARSWRRRWRATACCRAPTSPGCAPLLAATVVAGGGVGWRVGRRATWWRWPGSRSRAAALAGRDRGQGHRGGPVQRGGGGGRVRSVRLIPCLDVTGRPRRQGRALRRPDRRGRPGRAGRPLRRRGRRRGHLPRHHRLLGRARHHGRRWWRARPSRSSSPSPSAVASGRRRMHAASSGPGRTRSR